MYYHSWRIYSSLLALEPPFSKTYLLYRCASEENDVKINARQSTGNKACIGVRGIVLKIVLRSVNPREIRLGFRIRCCLLVSGFLAEPGKVFFTSDQDQNIARLDDKIRSRQKSES
jgi:hypothetical protein